MNLEHENFTTFRRDGPPSEKQQTEIKEVQNADAQQPTRSVNLLAGMRELENERLYMEPAVKSGRFGETGDLGLSKRQK